MTPRFVARQLSHPSGILGRVIVRLMNRMNANINAFAVQQLQLTPGDRVLEIGFGGGLSLPVLIESAAFVGGVDRSDYSVQRARARFAAAVRDGRADFRVGNVEALPFDAGSFDKVCTVNTVYFWKSLDPALMEIRRVLRPGGRVVFGVATKERLKRMGVPSDIFTTRTPEEIIAALARNRIGDARIEQPRPTTPWHVIVASSLPLI